VSKLAQELLGSHTSGVEIMIARAFNHFGPRQDPAFSTSGFARQIAAIEAGLQPPEIAVGNLVARRDLTDVRDTVRAYRAIAERGRPGRPYNVCSGRAVAVREVLDLLIARARVPIRVHVDPGRLRPNDVPLLLGDPSRLRAELGWTPTIPLEQTLDDILASWRREVR
jgi:GDP-4-dehydro-6-deoxy-D-mannose reductase